MSVNQHINCLAYFRHQYKKAASKKEKTQIINEVCIFFQYHRKAAIRYLNKPAIPTQKRKRGRKPRYDPDIFRPVLKQFWFAADQPCGKRLKALLPEWLPFYAQEYGPIEEDMKKKLLTLSSASIDRLLKHTRTQLAHKGRSGTKPGSLIKQHIPIKVEHWDDNKPGFMETDTVALCGQSLAGDFVWCITMTDIASCWTECRATWNKGSAGVLEQLKDIENKLPFPMLGFDSDNGCEFLNWHLVRHYQERANPVQFTRSRPYKKNDNAHVEQKNWSHVRQLFGYDRFGNAQLVSLMNGLLANEYSLLQNHFLPNSKLIDKERINSTIKKKHDKPRTPYQRLMDFPEVPNDIKMKLKIQHDQLNPFQLKKCIELKLKKIFALVSVTPNVRHRL